MLNFFLFALFFVLFASRTLGFDLSLAPGLSVKNAFLYLTFLALAIETAITRRRKLELMPVFVPLGLYMLYAIFTWLVIVLILQYPAYSLRLSLISLKSGPVEWLLVILIYFYGIKDTSSGLWVMRNMVWLIIIGNVVTVVDALDMPNLNLIELREDGRVGGTIGNSNEYAGFLALFMPVMVALYWTEGGLKRLLAGAGLAVSGLAFLMALSRGAIVGLVAAGVMGAFYLRSLIPGRVLVRAGGLSVLACVLIVIGGFAVGYGDLVMERFGQSGQDLTHASSGRTKFWAQALGSMMEHPVTFITGFGWDAYANDRQFHFGTHNAYLNILYDLGMIGLGLFLLTTANVVRAVRARIDRAGPDAKAFLFAFLFGFIAMLISIVFGDMYSSWIYVWAFVGIVLRIAVCEAETETVAQEERGQFGEGIGAPKEAAS